MNKIEFVNAVMELKFNKSDFDDWSKAYEKEKGFDDCKEKVLKLAQDLDVEGLTIQSFELFRKTLTDMTALYSELFLLQRELFDKNKIICDLQNQIHNKPPDLGEKI